MPTPIHPYSRSDYAKNKYLLKNWTNYYTVGPEKDEGDLLKGKWCLLWQINELAMQGFIIFASFFTVLINAVLKAVMKQLVYLERPQTRTAYLKSVFELVMWVQVLNTGIVTIVVNGNLQAFQDSNSNTTSFLNTATGIFFSGNHQDMDMKWYVDVGTSLMFTMIINLSFVPLFPMITWLTGKIKICVNRGCTCCPAEPKYTAEGKLDANQDQGKGKNPHSKSTDQHALDEIYHGPRLMLELRYASLFACLLVSMFYSAGMPVLIVIAFVQFTVSYWVDKWSFLRVYRTPCKFNSALAKTANKMMW